MGTFILESATAKKDVNWCAGKMAYDEAGNYKYTKNYTGDESVTVTLEFTNNGDTSDFTEEDILNLLSKMVNELKKE